MLLRKAATRRTASLNGLELLPILDAAANIVDNLPQRSTHRHLDKAHVVDLSGQGEHLRPLGFFRADGGKPLGTPGEDDGHVGQSLHVIHIGRPTHVARFGGERRFQRRFSAFAFHGMDKGCLFAADEGAGAVADLNVKVEARTQDVFSQQAVFTGLGNGHLKPVHGQRIFCADVNETMVSVDAVAADHHGFHHRVGVSFHDGTVHECTGVTLIGIAHHVLVGSVELAGNLPLHPGRESGAAAAAKATGLDIGQYLQTVPLEALRQGFVTVPRYVLEDVLGINETAISQRYTHLLAVEVHVFGVTDVVSATRILVEEAFHLFSAQNVGGDNLLHILRMHGGVEGIVRDNLDNGAFFAEAEAAGNHHLHLIGHPVGGQAGAEVLHDFGTVGGFATGTAAAEDLHVRRSLLQAAGVFLQSLVAFLPQGKRLDGFPSDVFQFSCRSDSHICRGLTMIGYKQYGVLYSTPIRPIPG